MERISPLLARTRIRPLPAGITADCIEHNTRKEVTLREQVLEPHHRKAGDFLEVAQIVGCDAVAQFQGCDSDQQIGKRKPHSFCLALTIDLSDTRSNWYGHQMNG